MSWTEGTGAGLSAGALAWVEHPAYGVVWAELGYYTEEDPDGKQTHRWIWTAYGIGEAFHIDEALRYQVVPKPESP